MEIIIVPAGNYLRFREQSFNEQGVAVEEKTAFKAIDPTKKATALAWAKTQKWAFSGSPNNGVYQIELVAEGELVSEAATASAAV